MGEKLLFQLVFVANAGHFGRDNATAAEQQRKQTIIASTAAEKERELNETQRAISDKAYNNKMGFSTEQFVELEKTRINADACSKSKSCVLIAGSNGVQPVLPVQ